jgi:hypothetical protein
MAAYISAATSIWMSWRGNYPDRIASPGAVGRGSQAGAVRSRAGVYRGLLGPIDVLLRDKPNLIIVPTGALTALRSVFG